MSPSVTGSVAGRPVASSRLRHWGGGLDMPYSMALFRPSLDANSFRLRATLGRFYCNCSV